MPFKHKLSVRLAISRVLLVGLTSASLSCGGTSVSGPDTEDKVTPNLVDLVISPPSTTLAVHDSADFQAYGVTTSGDSIEVSVTWSSPVDNPVEKKGKGLGRLKAKKPGKFDLMAQADSADLADTVNVTVVEASVANIEVSPANLTLEVGASGQFGAVVQDAANNRLYDREVDWSSSDETVATVDISGFVTAIGEGQVSISADAEGVLGSAEVTVTLTPVDSVVVAPNAFSLLVGQIVQLNASAIDASGDTLPNRPIIWSTSDATVATVNTEGLVTAVAPGAAEIRASGADGRPGASSGTVLDVVTSSDYPNEPPGFTTISERALSELATCDEPFTRIDGWDDKEACSSIGSIVEDWSARKSPPNVYEMRYPAGFAGGTGAGLLQKSFVGGPFTKVYLSMWVRLSSNWQGHKSNTNKMFFAWIGSEPRFFVSAEGSGNGPLVPELRLQGGLPDPRPHLGPNVNTSKLVERGAWQRWEFVLQCNTPA